VWAPGPCSNIVQEGAAHAWRRRAHRAVHAAGPYRADEGGWSSNAHGHRGPASPACARPHRRAILGRCSRLIDEDQGSPGPRSGWDRNQAPAASQDSSLCCSLRARFFLNVHPVPVEQAARSALTASALAPHPDAPPARSGECRRLAIILPRIPRHGPSTDASGYLRPRARPGLAGAAP